MHDDDFLALVQDLRRFGGDLSDVEVKRAHEKLPKSTHETLSAFANARGGVLILGLDEKSGFQAVGVRNAGKLVADLGSYCSEFEPPIRAVISTRTFESVDLIVAEIPETLPADKPCHLKSMGAYQGSFIRVGDGDRRMTQYEILALMASKGQPKEDLEPVPGTSVDDLDAQLVGAFLEQLRARRPYRYADMEDHEALRRMRVLIKDDDGRERLSLGGLLALGEYPQEHFPQLMVSFVHYPESGGGSLQSGERFLDNVALEGPVPVMVRDAMQALKRNMKRRAVIQGVGRTDVWEYPEVALREALVNALVHRDLAGHARGAQVQVSMYPDRLVIQNPGGLFGAVTIDNLEDNPPSSARNAVLMDILQDVPVPGTGQSVCEKRGSGIQDMLQALRAAHMGPPAFTDRLASFKVVFPNHTLLDGDTVEWINSLREHGLTNSQCIGLALLRSGESLTNPRYRAATGVDSRVATSELQDLVARELAVQEGARRSSRYRLHPALDAAAARASAPAESKPQRRKDRTEEILAALGDRTLSRVQIEAATGLPRPTVLRWLDRLKRQGLVESVGQSRNDIRYRRTGQQRLDEPI
ncbi:putative DNA binding domain-containing protein [Nocardiopsis sp. RSe5-2]|uniref:DNA binding domain-containing protein n=1 Tax=Nocardiopsis endophytica TaxID=3018445 RepID=A0ABT4TXD0_9ACTN|nr:ATP-binding protein [Nocardiopsis endophytica]MDA2809353.1 putative DNA binding domain-containing protein [Nocardiopsis endophytica]